MKKRFLPLSMLLITIVLAQASFVANAAGGQGKYTPRNGSKATFSSFMKSIRANQETGLIDPALMMAGQRAAQATSGDVDPCWSYAGPDNYGGMTKAMVYDADGNVLIGTMGGDIYKTTNNGITFGRVTNSNHLISCMAKDSEGTIYVGTGDGRDANIHNGLENLGYATSFVGDGIYVLDQQTATLNVVAGTENFQFVNELACAGNVVYAATADGLKKIENGSVTQVLSGIFRSVKANNNGDILAADTTDVFLSLAGGTFNKITGAGALPDNEYPKVIGMSENDKRYMYIAYYRYDAINKIYCTGDIYFTDNNGESWQLAMAGTNMYPIFGTSEDPDIFNGYICVYPDNPKKLIMGNFDLWLVQDYTGLGANSFLPKQISYNMGDVYSSIYVHSGIQNVIFDPSNSNVFFAGTNGGVFKGTYSQSVYTYSSCNRYFLTDKIHTSVARMMAVGVGGTDYVLGGCLDHGTVGLSGDTSLNNITTGYNIFPHQTLNSYVSTYFTESYAGGPCAVSTISPAIFFVSGTGALATPIYRTETAGVDFDENFEGGGEDPVITNANAFRTPYALFEEYNDQHSHTIIREPVDNIVDSTYILDSIIYVYDTTSVPPVIIDSTIFDHWVYIHELDTLDNVINLDTLFLAVRDTLHVGDSCFYYSHNGGYPIDYIAPELPDSLKDKDHKITNAQGQIEYVWIHGDTIRGLHNPITTNYVVAVEGAVYMTRNALVFNKKTDWLKMSTIQGLPTAVAFGDNGDLAMVGTVEGMLYTFKHLSDVFYDVQASVNNVVNGIVKMTADTTFKGRAITSIAIDPKDANNVVVTLGNYGNNDYVYQSNGSGFTSIQGNLSKSPVYASIIEKFTGAVFVGTEHGVFVYENNTWTKKGNVSCPVMDIKQAVMDNHADKIDKLVDEAGHVTEVVYPGIYNDGDIYIATYGSGILKYKNGEENNEPGNDDDEGTTTAEHLNVYPNPVRDFAQFDINVADNTTVSYVIYDLSGRMITNGNLGKFSAGVHTMNVETKDLSSGSYIIRVVAGDKAETGKFLVY